MFDLLKRPHRRALHDRAMDAAWRGVIDRNVPYAASPASLTPEERRHLEGLVQVFVDGKSFEGCGGLVIDDEIRVTIAAHACILALHRGRGGADAAARAAGEAGEECAYAGEELYPGLDSILVYPHAYRAPGARGEGGVVMDTGDGRLGESWTRGVVVLAWDHVRSATHHVARGENVVLHEFAHQLDAADGAMDGAPDLGTRARYATWARVLGDEYAELSARLQAGEATDLDPYAATNPSEFFAVVTEAFFESPAWLVAHHPALYDELAAFYRQDPDARRAPGVRGGKRSGFL